METLIIIGAGGHGKVVADIAQKTNKYKDIFFIDDFSKEDNCLGHDIIGSTNEIDVWITKAEFFVAIGKSDIREKLVKELIGKKAKIATLIHPQACIGNSVEIGYGTVIMAGTVINPDTKIGNGVIINTASSVDHENVIEDYSHISGGVHLGGTVYIKKHTWIGIGATVSNNITICNNCMVGAGAVVVKDIVESGVYVGIPARKIR